jgi:ADP-ribose pyrophosphatase YjhB (NUDIX family)
MDVPVCAVGAIVLHEGKLLLVKRDREPARGRWSLPGGRVMLGESLTEAVVREVREETGVDVDVDGLCGLAEWISRGDDTAVDHHYVIIDYYATARSTTLTPGDDAADARWVSMAELPEYELSAGLLEFLADRGILARGRAPVTR